MVEVIFSGKPMHPKSTLTPPFAGQMTRKQYQSARASTGAFHLSKKCEWGSPEDAAGQRGWLLITEFIKEDSPFCLTRAITRTMIGLC